MLHTSIIPFICQWYFVLYDKSLQPLCQSYLIWMSLFVYCPGISVAPLTFSVSSFPSWSFWCVSLVIWWRWSSINGSSSMQNVRSMLRSFWSVSHCFPRMHSSSSITLYDHSCRQEIVIDTCWLEIWYDLYFYCNFRYIFMTFDGLFCFT